MCCQTPLGGAGKFFNSTCRTRHKQYLKSKAVQASQRAANAQWHTRWHTKKSQTRKKPLIIKGLKKYLAERAGFEPAVGDYPTHAFQACDLNRSSTSPEAAHSIRICAAVNEISGFLEIYCTLTADLISQPSAGRCGTSASTGYLRPSFPGARTSARCGRHVPGAAS